jgi:hypothetical protein
MSTAWIIRLTCLTVIVTLVIVLCTTGSAVLNESDEGDDEKNVVDIVIPSNPNIEDDQKAATVARTKERGVQPSVQEVFEAEDTAVLTSDEVRAEVLVEIKTHIGPESKKRSSKDAKAFIAKYRANHTRWNGITKNQVISILTDEIKPWSKWSKLSLRSQLKTLERSEASSQRKKVGGNTT